MANENRIKILEDEGLIKYLPLPIDYPNFVIREGNSGFKEINDEKTGTKIKKLEPIL